MQMKTITLSQRLYYKELDEDLYPMIRHDLMLYSSILHTAYHQLYDIRFHNVPKPKNMIRDLKLKYGTNDYLPLAAVHEARALLKASIESNRLHQKKVEKKIKRITNRMKNNEKKLQKIDKQLQMFIEKSHHKKTTKADYLEEVQVWKPKKKQLKNEQKMLLFRLHREEYRLSGLKKRVKQCCFGGRKQMKQRTTMPYEDWKREYRLKRTSRMLIPGRRQGKYGNNLFKYHVSENKLIYRSASGRDIELPIEFHYQKEELIRAVKMKHNTPGKAICYELRDHGEYFIIKAIVEVVDKDIQMQTCNGVYGMDLNIDHMAVSETDANGNLIGMKIYTYDLKHKTSNQRKAILRETIKNLGHDLKGNRKPLIIEKLSFENKKEQMLYENKRQNGILSEFAYGQIKTMLYSRMRKDDIMIQETSPYLTSQIGRLKYSRRMGMNIHMSASYVIARRGMGLTERIPEELKCYGKSNVKRITQWKKIAKEA